MNPYFYEVKKPLYETAEGDTVGIYDKRISDCIRNRQMIFIKSKNAEGLFYPKWIKANCPTFEKIYLRPNQPMREYKIFIARKKKKSQIEIEKEEYLKYIVA